jgi:hypothetical protein
MRLVVSGLASLLPLAVWIADWQITDSLRGCLRRCRLRISFAAAFGGADWKIADCRLRIDGLQIGRLADWRVAYCGLRIADCGLLLQIADCGLRIADCRIADWRIADCGLRVADGGLLLKVEFRISLVVDFDDFS